MRSTDLLMDAFDRVRDAIHPAVNGLTPDELAYRPGGDTNSVAWLAWHLTRIQDHHVAELRGAPQVWTAAGWSDRFGLPFDDSDTGYGHDPDAVAAVRAVAADLLGYFEDVHAATAAYVSTLDEADLERIVDTRWDPPVTVGIRLVSVVADDLQHSGQAAYVRGMLPTL